MRSGGGGEGRREVGGGREWAEEVPMLLLLDPWTTVLNVAFTVE